MLRKNSKAPFALNGKKRVFVRVLALLCLLLAAALLTACKETPGSGTESARPAETPSVSGAPETDAKTAPSEEDPDFQTGAVLLSPDGSVAVTLKLDGEGELVWSVAKDGRDAVKESRIALYAVKRMSETPVFESLERRTVDETFEMNSGSFSRIGNRAREWTLRFSGGYSVTVRAYNDGAAFRQTLEGSGIDAVQSDRSTFTLPSGSDVWASVTDTDKNTYSRSYTKQKIEAFPEKAYFPLLYRTEEDLWGLILEADLFSSGYCGSMLTGEGENVLGLTFAYAQTAPVKIALPFSTPWRAVVLGDLAAIVENTMADRLAPAAEGDFSFAETGVAAWSWLANGTARQDDPDLIRRYLDLAAEMKWEYCILDEGFRPHAADYTYSNRTYSGFYPWMSGIVSYAKEKNVKLIAWLNRREIQTDSSVAFLEQVKAAGFAGIKADFFDTESASVFPIYERIVKKAASLGLVVNLHGTNKPTGERVTYPNVIAKEAVRGDEIRATLAAYTTALPFLRGPLGSADFTPTVYPFPKSDTTAAHQAALATLIECGMPSMASTPEEYYGSPFYWYYYDLPSRWDELRFLDGYPQSHAILARRTGDAWYVSAVTANARSVTIPFSFLGEGVYNAAVYADKGDGTEGTVSYREIAQTDSLTFRLLKGGGLVLKLVPKEEAPQTLSFEDASLSLGVNEEKKIAWRMNDSAFPDLVWASADEGIARVVNGRVTGVAPGRTTVTATCAGSGKSASLTVLVAGGAVLADGWSVYNPPVRIGQQVRPDPSEPYRLTLSTLPGELGLSAQKKPMNVWMRTVPEGDFTVTVKVTGELSAAYQTAVLGVYASDTAAIMMTRRFHPGLAEKLGSVPPGKVGRVGNVIDFMTHAGSYQEKCVADPSPAAPLWLRITRRGNIFSGAYSYDGVTFAEMPGTLQNAAVSQSGNLKIALACHAGSGGCFLADVVFEDLTVNGERVPFLTPVS